MCRVSQSRLVHVGKIWCSAKGVEKCQITGSVLDKNKIQKLTFLLDYALFTLSRNGLTGLCLCVCVCARVWM